ncbi:uncharacterized protein LOC112689064 [Sipha flava]|uniref:Uncharacterized protein LOC112689064 n=1 Tax=Sipha flava TaxID=143950 RepID=A0A8B8G623_9HEMI|nr:uncharacterized protein LOC112689064 [Sipha flava]
MTSSYPLHDSTLLAVALATCDRTMLVLGDKYRTEKWNSKTTIKFVLEVRTHECQWNVKCKEYKNKQMRESAYQKTVQAMNIVGFSVPKVNLYYMYFCNINSNWSGVIITKILYSSSIANFLKILTELPRVSRLSNHFLVHNRFFFLIRFQVFVSMTIFKRWLNV